jgi:hypothetical protein
MPPSISKSANIASRWGGDSISSGDSDSEIGSKATEGSDADKDQLAQKETHDVFLLRVLVVIVLLLAAVAVSLVVFFITKKAEVDEFETQYTALADTILRAFEDIITQKLGAISSVGVAAIAHGIDHDKSWPLLTLSSFQERSATARSLSGALFISLNPVVSDTQRTDWEKFVVKKSGWIQEGFEYQEDLEVDGFEKPMTMMMGGVEMSMSGDEMSMPGDNMPEDNMSMPGDNMSMPGDNMSMLEDNTSMPGDNMSMPGDMVGSNSTEIRDEIFYIDEDEGKMWTDPGPGPYLPSKFSFPASQHFKSYRCGTTAITVLPACSEFCLRTTSNLCP